MILLASLSLLTASVQAKLSPKTIESDLINSTGEKIGKVSLTETKQGVNVRIQASKLPPGEHDIHFHETGLCNPPKFSTAGEHFNPEGAQHGLKNPKGSHAGDLPNLKVEENGTVTTKFSASNVTLEAGETSLLKKGATALIIHSKVDDQVTQPSGNSGDRIACATIDVKSNKAG